MRGDVDILAAPLDQRLGDVRLATDFDHLGDGPNEPYDLVVVVERALAPIRKNNRGISGVERLRTPVTGSATTLKVSC